VVWLCAGIGDESCRNLVERYIRIKVNDLMAACVGFLLELIQDLFRLAAVRCSGGNLMPLVVYLEVGPP
jgi:hypothetical protein